MALAITAVSPDVVPSNGGYELVLTGTFDLDTPYRVTLGFPVTGAVGEAQAYQPSGQGKTALADNSTTLTVYSPELEAGNIVDVYVEEAATPATNSTLSGKLSVVDPDFKTLSFQMRTLFPPKYKLGPRDFTLVPRVTGDIKNYVLYSEDYTSQWLPSGVSFTTGLSDPFGGLNATSMSEIAGSLHGIRQSGTYAYTPPANQTTVFSVYVSAGAGARDWCWVRVNEIGIQAWVNFRTGVIGTVVPGAIPFTLETRSVGNGWYRITLRARASATPTKMEITLYVADSDGNISYTGSVSDAIRLTAFQIDHWPVERKYFPTTSTPVT